MDLLNELERDTSLATGEQFARLVAGYFTDTRTGEGRVSTGHTPEELAARFDEPAPQAGRPLAEVIARLRDEVIPDGNRLCHPRYMGHQVSAPLPAAVWTEALTGALNQSGAVWEMSPVGTILEHQVIRWMCDLAGFGPDAGGAFTSGGTEATFMGLLAARQAALPEVWMRGVGANPPVVICGEHAHYAVGRAVGQLGLGTDHLLTVPSRDYTLDVAELDRQISRLAVEGRPIMAVVATAGTTATGSFDDIDAIGRIAEARGIWFHVDGAHGASALWSRSHRDRLRGIERANSIAWDPHKMMLLPLTASVVLVRRERDLESTFNQKAPYLFHGGSGGRQWDQGTRAVQCSRRVDALKVWVALQRYGTAAFGSVYDHLCGRAAQLHRLIAGRSTFEAMHEPQSNILCFRYVGDGMCPAADLDDLNLRLRETYNRSGEGWITTTLLGGCRVLRVTLMNPRTTEQDLQALLDGLERLGSRV